MRVMNQFTEQFSVNQLAEMVTKEGAKVRQGTCGCGYDGEDGVCSVNGIGLLVLVLVSKQAVVNHHALYSLHTCTYAVCGTHTHSAYTLCGTRTHTHARPCHKRTLAGASPTQMGLKVETLSVPNPRVELEEHYYNAKNSKLEALGLQPHLMEDSMMSSLLEIAVQYKASLV